MTNANPDLHSALTLFILVQSFWLPWTSEAVDQLIKPSSTMQGSDDDMTNIYACLESVDFQSVIEKASWFSDFPPKEWAYKAHPQLPIACNSLLQWLVISAC